MNLILVVWWYTCLYVSRGICVLVFVYTYMRHVNRWNILHAISLNMARCFASLFSRDISQNFHSQRFYIQQNHQTHYNWSECQPQIESKYFLFVSYVKMYSICQITTAARVCHGFAKDGAIIHSICYLNLLLRLIRINRPFHQHHNLSQTPALV